MNGYVSYMYMCVIGQSSAVLEAVCQLPVKVSPPVM